MMMKFILYLCKKNKLFDQWFNGLTVKYIDRKKIPVIESEKQKKILVAKCRNNLALILSGDIEPRVYKKGIE